MRVSRLEKEKIREKILVHTLVGLKVWGHSAAPVDKIMKGLGLTSGALYSHFKSKDDLIAQVILCELDRLIEIHSIQVQKHGGNATGRYIEFYLSESHLEGIERGCMFVALGADLHRLKPAIRVRIEAKMESLFLVFSGGFPKGSGRHRLALAKFIFPSMVGALIFARSQKSRRSKTEILQATKKQLLKLLEVE